MLVTVLFPGGREIEWGFDYVPRKGEAIEFRDPESPIAQGRVADVTWVVGERGCAEAKVLVRW